jgi:hypothetical protein
MLHKGMTRSGTGISILTGRILVRLNIPMCFSMETASLTVSTIDKDDCVMSAIFAFLNECQPDVNNRHIRPKQSIQSLKQLLGD